MSIEQTNKSSHRLRDYVLYIVISFAVVAVLFVGAASHVGQAKFMKWFFFVPYTAFTFGFVVEKCRSLWRRDSFWLAISSLLLLHCIAMAEVLTRVKQVEGGWFGAAFFESLVLLNFIRWLLRPTPPPM